LGNRTYFFGGNTPTTIDADVYSWLALLFEDKAQTGGDPWVDEMKEEYPNLVQHTERMKALLYP
jgi:glutathione S-transferase